MIAIDCGPLNNPLNGEVIQDDTTLNSIATYTCIDGYIPSDEETRVCRADGAWSGQEPICEPLEGEDCGMLPNPKDGYVDATGTSIGSIAQYSCNEGYSVSSGDTSRICQQDLSWSGEPPVCQGRVGWAGHNSYKYSTSIDLFLNC